MIRHFRNENGEDVTIDVHEEDVNGVESICMSITGPESETEWELTKGEANELYRMLGSVLGWKN